MHLIVKKFKISFQQNNKIIHPSENEDIFIYLEMLLKLSNHKLHAQGTHVSLQKKSIHRKGINLHFRSF